MDVVVIIRGKAGKEPVLDCQGRTCRCDVVRSSMVPKMKVPRSNKPGDSRWS